MPYRRRRMDHNAEEAPKRRSTQPDGECYRNRNSTIFWRGPEDTNHILARAISDARSASPHRGGGAKVAAPGLSPHLHRARHPG